MVELASCMDSNGREELGAKSTSRHLVAVISNILNLLGQRMNPCNRLGGVNADGFNGVHVNILRWEHIGCAVFKYSSTANRINRA